MSEPTEPTQPAKFSGNNPKLLIKRVKANFPALTWNSFKFINEGWDHEVLILDDKLVFRFPTDQEYTDKMQNEIEILARLKPLLKVNIPEYSYVPLDYSFAGYKLVPGKSLQIELFDGLESAAVNKIAVQLAEFLSVMHTLLQGGHKFKKLMPTTIKEDQADLKQQSALYLQNVLSKSEYEIVLQILAKTDKLLEQSLPNVFLHGDIYNRHLLWNESSEKLGIIDFSDMNKGDPAFDFAELYEYGDKFVQNVYSLYAGPKDNTFLDRAWIYQQWVGIFMMVDHFIYHKTSFEVARATFDRTKMGRQPLIK